ncbi:MAG: hypothetical protein Q8R76_02110 [Candidatus Omnitrophota bacterium]|nr:hypothetical protein [Candidatus Omnitrophota bacterium]
MVQKLPAGHFSVLSKNPTILLLFLVLALIEFAALLVLFLAPSELFSSLFAPVIRRFWGEQFLHYPENFVLLPKLFTHAHFVIVTFIGVVVSALVIKKVEGDVCGSESISILAAAGFVLRKYFKLFIIWIAMYAVSRYAVTLVLLQETASIGYRFGMIYGVGILLHSFFAFLFPSVVLSEGKFLKSVWEGLFLSIKNFFCVLLVLAVPVAVLIGFSFIKSMTRFYIELFSPESVLYVLMVGIIVSVMVDMFITTATTILFLQVRKQS